jgi:hypothetical protein
MKNKIHYYWNSSKINNTMKNKKYLTTGTVPK